MHPNPGISTREHKCFKISSRLYTERIIMLQETNSYNDFYNYNDLFLQIYEQLNKKLSSVQGRVC